MVIAAVQPVGHVPVPRDVHPSPDYVVVNKRLAVVIETAPVWVPDASIRNVHGSALGQERGA